MRPWAQFLTINRQKEEERVGWREGSRMIQIRKKRKERKGGEEREGKKKRIGRRMKGTCSLGHKKSKHSQFLTIPRLGNATY